MELEPRKLQACLRDYQEWTSLLHIKTVSDLNAIVDQGRKDFSELVLICEKPVSYTHLNTGRFTVEPIIHVLTNFNERTLQEDGIAYPYWENAARLVENQLAWTLLCCFIFSLFPLGCLIYLIVKAVSYTHLDVYKRQGMASLPTKLFLTKKLTMY